MGSLQEEKGSPKS